MEETKTFFERTASIRAALLLLMTKAETEQELKTLEEAAKALSDLCPNPHIN